LRDRELLAWLVASGAVAVSAVVVGISFLWPHVEVKETTQYVEHPKGVAHRAKYDSDDEIVVGMHKVCTLYSNFDPGTVKGFKIGQRLISDCSIVKTGPKG
jgi:hypothetical protein